MSRKSISVLRSTYEEYVGKEYSDLGNYLIQCFDWASDGSIASFKNKLKKGIENNGQTEPGRAFPLWKLKEGFIILEEQIRNYI